MSSTNRNALCPCGSGQKFKKCCLIRDLNKGEAKPKPNPMKDFLCKQDKELTLTAIAGLMLLPENHGKNLRLEEFAWYAAKYCINAADEFDTKGFQAFVGKYFARESMEDPAESVFTANVSFVDGDSVVFPGIEIDSHDVLERLLLVLTQPKGDFPDEYINLVQGVVGVMLRLSNAVAQQAGYQRYMPGTGGHHDPIEFTRKLNEVRIYCSLPDSLLKDQCDKFGIEAESFLDLVSTPDDFARPFSVVADDNPLLEKPLVRVEDGYVLAVPTSLLAALIRYIFKQAKRFDVYDRVVETYHKHNFTSIKQHLYGIGWAPAKTIFSDQEWGNYESFFKIDTDLFGHLLYIPDRTDIDGETIEARIHSVAQSLESSQGASAKILLLLVTGLSGDQIMVMLGEMPDNVQKLQFDSSDAHLLLNDPEVDRLTLWKFAKALKVARTSIHLISANNLDLFSYFQKNDQSFFHSDESYNLITVMSGNACAYRTKLIRSLDKHIVIRTVEGGVGYVPVERHAQYAPIYRLVEPSPESWLALDHYQSPIWVKNIQAHNTEARAVADQFADAVLYWLFHLPGLDPLASTHQPYPIEIELIFDQKFLDNAISDSDLNLIDNSAIPLDLSIKSPHSFSLRIPWQLIGLILARGNGAEQLVMKQVIHGLNELHQRSGGQDTFSEDKVNQIIAQGMNNPRRRMILTLPMHKDARCDPRWLSAEVRDISEAEVSHLLRTLTSYLAPGREVAQNIEHSEDKNALCHEVVHGLVTHIGTLLAKYNTAQLIEYLMLKNEAIIHKREYDKLLIPAQIECFSDYPSEVNKLKRSGNNLVQVSLSIRCLIEFAAAMPSNGDKVISEDSIDELLAVMEQIVQWGAMSDAITMGIDNMEMGLLPSGRIGTDKSFSEDYLSEFFHAYTEEQLSDYVEEFAQQQEPIESISRPSRTAEDDFMIELNEAFKAQFDIELNEFVRLHFILTRVAISREVSVIRIEEEKLYQAVQEIDPAFNRSTFDKAMHLLTLKSRKGLSTPPRGYKGADVYPWRYNRELAYLRRPLYKEVVDSATYYQFGFRHVTVALHNLLYLLHNGQFNDPKYTHMKTVSSRVNHIKGGEYRRKVYEWLHQHSTLKVIPHEVKMPDPEYGDIDVLAWDEANQVVYSLECKNTVPARNIYDMKVELDKYFGRDLNSGMVIKHVNRHQWLEQHPEQLRDWLKIPKAVDFTLQSIVITSVEIPAGYILRQELPLPILSFTALKKRFINSASD